MESIIHKIRFMRDEMGPAEKLICDYILNNANEITGISISELAKRCGCGDATVVRFSRKLGFDGYQSLKIGIATEIKLSSSVEEEITKKV
ncbi:MAG: MurR/RpiR family transcriptional regulator, partial [Clostridia bacterium]|nr:MurR/RpiR family transcriptional regulator [Clostridia bacterium]